MRFVYLIAAICLGILCSKSCNQPDRVEHTKPCKVLGKLQTSAGYKVQAHFYLILECEGKEFELDVTPTTYWRAKEGETLYFSLSYNDIYGDRGANGKEILSFFGFIASLILAGIGIYGFTRIKT